MSKKNQNSGTVVVTPEVVTSPVTTQRRLTLAELHRIKAAVMASQGQLGLSSHIAVALGISISSARKVVKDIDKRIASFGQGHGGGGHSGMDLKTFNAIWNEKKTAAQVTGQVVVTS